MRISIMAAGAAIVFMGLAVVGTSLLLGPSRGHGTLDLKLVDKPTLMTAAYKVYGNSAAVNGKYWLGKLTLKNSGTGSLKDVKISYQIPDYIPWTTPENHAEILPGQTLVVPIYPRLPAKVTQITSMTPSSLEVKIDYDDGSGPKSRTEKRDFEFRGIHEIEYSSLPQSEIVTYYDANDNSELNCAWVTEEDPVVRGFYTKVSEKAGGFGTMDNAKDITQLARSTYDYMVATGMTYSGTKGVPEKKGDEYVLVQSMRLPRDIIYGNSGLCVELAQLWASIAINSGARCYLVMIPGHCFPVLQTSSFGDGTLLPVEATGVGGGFEGGNLGKPMSFEDAVKVATDNFNKVRSGETPGIIVDIMEYRDQGIRPPELADIDRPALTKMLDERLAQHQGGAVAGGGTGGGRAAAVTGNGGGGNVGGGGGAVPPAVNGVRWSDPGGRISLVYPANWATNAQLVAQMQQVMPGYALSCADPVTACGIDVIYFSGANNANQVISAIVGLMQNMGAQVQVGQPQGDTLGGRQSVVVPIAVATPNGIVGGVINVVPVQGGMMAIDVGGPQANLQRSMGDMTKVIQSIQIGN